MGPWADEHEGRMGPRSGERDGAQVYWVLCEPGTSHAVGSLG